jgi:hypothetical protein
MTEIIIDQAHRTIGHAGNERTNKYIHRFYWWSTLSKDVAKILCDLWNVSGGEAEHATASRVVTPAAHPLATMGIHRDGLHWTAATLPGGVQLHLGGNRQANVDGALGGVEDERDCNGGRRAVPEGYRQVAWRSQLHCIRQGPTVYLGVLDRWHRLLGTKLMMSTSFHPQTDGVTERVNRVVNTVLRAVIRPDQSDWFEKLPMVEFAINSSENKSTGLHPVRVELWVHPYAEGLLDRVPASFKPGVRHYAEKAQSSLLAAHDAIIAARVNQTYHANKRRREEPAYRVGDRVWLSTEYLAMPKGRVRKLMPKFIGPFAVTKVG